jgi:benzoate-CoA ligase family protein
MTWDPPERLNIAERFLAARLAEGRGGRVALRLADRTVTYAGVKAAVDRVAHQLAALGVRPEERVVIALPDGLEYVATLFAVLAVGAVAVMVNPQLSAAELAGILKYGRPRAAVVGDEGLATMRALAAEGADALDSLLAVVRGEGERSTIVGGRREIPVFAWPVVESSAPFPIFDTHRDDPAIWLFSGGTTGRPKAVVQSHRSFANTTELYARRYLGYREDDVTLSVPKLFFGYATGSNLFFPFSVGASAVLFPEKATAEQLYAQIARHRPTILVNVPTMVAQMVSHPGASAQDLSSLRFVTSAGEALPTPLYQRWQELFGVELLDGLGTAEMWHIFLSNRPGEVRPGTLGRVVPGFEIDVRDDDGRSVLPGEVGRLWVRGGSRAWGYWQELDKTAESFRGEWFVGGDLVSRDADGYVTYCGRGDDVLKVAGKWVVPAEVESCLASHPAVRECAVVGVTSSDGLTKPHAWVIAEGSGPELAAALKAWVRERLASHKHPREVTFVEQFPRTHLGKIDRAALRRG